MGLFEKRRFRTFLVYTDAYLVEDEKTHGGRDLATMTMRELYKDFSLTPETQEFVSHATCFMTDDVHLDYPAATTVKEFQTYCYSLAHYGTSSYIYPVYGLDGLP